jgi:hypothetical protein
MTLRQLTKLVDDLVEQYGLSHQLTSAWLRENGIDRLKFAYVTLRPEQLADLCRFARVE